jgi:long-chain alkane monooxygenase
LLFQAGSSTRGRAFAASHAEGVFVVETKETLAGPNNVIKDIRAQAAGIGRDPASIKFFQGITPVVGATEHEARQKAEELMEQISMDGMLAHISGSIGIDLSNIDLDASLETIQTGSMRRWTKSLIEAEPNKKKTFRDLIRARTAGRFLIGSPEQVADELGTFFDAGIDGFNLTYCTTPGTFVDFIDGVVPVLRDRGLVQKEYQPGTLREKIYGTSELSEGHPGRGYRRV